MTTALREPADYVEAHVDGVIFAEQPRGGITRVWVNLLRSLADTGECRITVYLPPQLAQRPDLPASARVVPYSRPVGLRPGRLFRRLNALIGRRRERQFWAKPRHGIFHSTHFTTYSSLILPQVLSVYDIFHEILPDCFDEPKRSAFAARRETCVRRSDHIVCCSTCTAGDVRRHYGIASSPPVAVVPLAVDRAFRPSGDASAAQAFRQRRTAGQPFLLYVGTRHPYKNFAGLLVAYAAWPQRAGFRLLACGGGPPSPQESALMRALGMRELVQFWSDVSDADLVAAYNAAAALVVPSLYEGFGLPLWEAMACGTPVVASRAGALPEVGGDVPAYFEFGPPWSMVRAMDEAVQLRRGCDRLDAGVRVATTRSWADVAREYLDVYREVVECGSPRSAGRPGSQSG
jgi:glycosyltransferase involved in cell wall biosynthesis